MPLPKLSARFAGQEAYVPGEQPQDMQYIKLNTNESPFPPAPAVREAISAAEIGRLNLYPDPEGRALREKLAEQMRSISLTAMARPVGALGLAMTMFLPMPQ